MSNQTPRPANGNTVTLLVCVTVLVLGVGSLAVVVFVFSDRDATVLCATLVGTLAPTIAAMAAVLQVGGVSSQVADVAEDTNKLANGLGDAKIRAAVADVLPDHLIDPSSRPQLAEDRRRMNLPEEHQ